MVSNPSIASVRLFPHLSPVPNSKAFYEATYPIERPIGVMFKRTENSPPKVVGDRLKSLKVITPMKAIRAKCLDCCCGSFQEVKECPVKSCGLWPYRLGHRPKKV